MKLRLSITAGPRVHGFIIEIVDGVPEIRREEDPVASRDRSLEVAIVDHDDNPIRVGDLEIAVEEAP